MTNDLIIISQLKKKKRARKGESERARVFMISPSYLAGSTATRSLYFTPFQLLPLTSIMRPLWVPYKLSFSHYQLGQILFSKFLVPYNIIKRFFPPKNQNELAIVNGHGQLGYGVLPCDSHESNDFSTEHLMYNLFKFF